jgi:hypothetical protein
LKKHYIKNEYDSKNPLTEVIDVFESYSHWYWFITEDKEKPYEADDGSFGRRLYGLVIGFEKEWGYIWSAELEAMIKKGKVWRVPKTAWSSISHVVTMDEKEVNV